MIHQYYAHKSIARIRQIPFEFTFEEWKSVWLNSGKWEERGRGSGKYCMARFNDIGPYSVNNVYITTNNENSKFVHTHWNNFKHNNKKFKGSIKGICIKTGSEIILEGNTEIEKAGFTSQSVYKCCNGKLKKHKGYTFKRI